MNLFSWQNILIFILLMGIVGFILFWPKPPEFEGIKTARDSIERITEANRILAMNARTLELNLTEARAKSKIDSGRFKAIISALQRNLSIKRTQVQPLIDSIPDLREFVQVADNVIELQRQRIDTLEQNLKFQEGLYTDLIRIKDKQIQNLTYISTQQNVIIADQEKALRKRSRGAKLWRAAAVTLGISGLLVGAQL